MLNPTTPPASGTLRPRPPARFRFLPHSPAFWFLFPAVAALAVIGIYPLLLAVYNSFHQYKLADLAAGTPFVGIDNYVATLTDASFWGALGRTVLFLCLTLPVEIAFGLFAALMLHRTALPWLRVAARVGLVIPMATTYAVVGLIGRLIFNRQFGVVNYLLSLFGLPPLDWLADPTLAFVSRDDHGHLAMDAVLRADSSRRSRHGAERSRGSRPTGDAQVEQDPVASAAALLAAGTHGHPDPAFGRHAEKCSMPCSP